MPSFRETPQRDPDEADMTVEPLPQNVAKTRHCLRCRTVFSSLWSGERICARCKSSNAWRSGGPITGRPNGQGD
jgi:hypothetical protein